MSRRAALLVLGAITFPLASRSAGAQGGLGGRTLIPVERAADDAPLLLDSATIARTGESRFLATWVWRLPPSRARGFAYDAELSRHEMDCAGARDRVLARWYLRNDGPVRPQRDAEPDTAWRPVYAPDSAAFHAACKFLLQGFPSRLAVRPATGLVQSRPALLNPAEIGREIARQYPVGLRREGTSWTVLVRARITANGVVDTASMEVVQAADPAFRPAALRVVPRLLFAPAIVDGRPVPVWITIPVYFTRPH
jgi:TonB family protein